MTVDWVGGVEVVVVGAAVVVVVTSISEDDEDEEVTASSEEEEDDVTASAEDDEDEVTAASDEEELEVTASAEEDDDEVTAASDDEDDELWSIGSIEALLELVVVRVVVDRVLVEVLVVPSMGPPTELEVEEVDVLWLQPCDVVEPGMGPTPDDDEPHPRDVLAEECVRERVRVLVGATQSAQGSVSVPVGAGPMTVTVFVWDLVNVPPLPSSSASQSTHSRLSVG